MSQKATALWQTYERIMKEDCKLPERDVWWDEFYEKARNLA
jgi:hypothetical protein